MKSSNKNFYEILSRKECAQAANVDRLSHNESESYMKNSETYYVAINTWLCLLEEVSPRCAMGVAEIIRRKGLIPTISLADDIADQIVHGNLSSQQGNVFDYLLQDVGLKNLCELENIKVLLFNLRFLKRLSPTAMDSVRDASIEKFLAINDGHYKRYHNIDTQSKDYVRGPKIQLPRPHIIKRAQRIANDILTLLPDGIQIYLCDGDFVYMPYKLEGNFQRTSCYSHLDGFISKSDHRRSWTYVSEIAFSEVSQRTLWDDRAAHHLTGFLKQFGRFSNGSSSEGYATQAEKIKDLGKYLNAFDGMRTYQTGKQSIKPLVAEKICKVRSVPKSFKANRIIAMEPSFNTYLAHAWLTFAEYAVNEGPYKGQLVLNDQSHNQYLAWQGSWKHDFCTRDLSGASDSISNTLGYTILPRKATWIMDLLRATKMDVNGKLITNNIFGTSGFTLTFVYESVIFLSLETAATEYCIDNTPHFDIDMPLADVPITKAMSERMYRSVLKRYRVHVETQKKDIWFYNPDDEYLQPITFGDDMLSDCRINEYIDEVLRDYGFVINETKSYTGDHPYRESCGEEYWNGYSVSSAKWPRHEFRNLVNPSAEELTSLIQLEHKIFEHFKAREFLILWIKNTKPGITQSRPYSEFSDLWVDYPEQKTTKGPYVAKGEYRLECTRWGHTWSKAYPSKKLTWSHYDICEYDHTTDIIPDDEDHRRVLHTTLITEFERPSGNPSQILEMWRYRQFLKNGPKPLDEWCAQLGVVPTEYVDSSRLFESKSKFGYSRDVQ